MMRWRGAEGRGEGEGVGAWNSGRAGGVGRRVLVEWKAAVTEEEEEEGGCGGVLASHTST